MFNRFINGLKDNIRLEILKASVSKFEEASCFHIRIDRDLRGTGKGIEMETSSEL